MIHFGTYEHTYEHTYELTYILTNKSLLKKSSYTKTSLTKKVPNDTSTCSKFFFRGRNPKIDRDRPKKPSFFTLPGNSSYTKTLLTKNVPNDTSPCSKFFFRGRNPKNDRDRLKKPSFLTENCG